MKKYLKVLVASMALILGLEGVNAESYKSIDASACNTIYTNYYFFLDANTPDYFNQGDLSSIKHNTIAEYSNNSWLTNNFDVNNIGYGTMDLGSGTTTSSDGITSLSLTDYYSYRSKSSGVHGAYTSGNKNYIIAHDWYYVNNDGTVSNKLESGANLSGNSVQNLVNASVNANTKVYLADAIDPTNPNPFKIRVNRSYYGYLTGNPATSPSGTKWYLQPAVFYIQYCSPKGEYTVTYDGNGKDVTNVPKKETSKDGECVSISDITPIREGYEFLGWNLKSDAKNGDSTYAKGKQYCGQKGDITLYAIWKEKEKDVVEKNYTIFYKPNTSDVITGMPDDFTTSIENDATIASNKPIRNGYTFLGWSTDATAGDGDPAFAPGSNYNARKDLTLYAIWKQNGNKPTPTPTDPDPGLPSNPATGVANYLLPLGGIASASGVGLGLLKKKKSFKQF